MARPVRVLIQSLNATTLAGLDATVRASADTAGTTVVARILAADGGPWRVHLQEPDVVVRHVSGKEWSLRVGGRGRAPVVFAVDDRVSGADIVRALRGGIRGLVSITEDLAALPRACQEIAAGSTYLSPNLVTLLANHLSGNGTGATFGLTAREQQVLRCLTAGKSPAEIASDVQIDHRTVKHNLANIYRKLGVRSQAAAVARAYREGLVA